MFQALGSVDLRGLLAARDAEIAELKALLEEASYQESELVYENRLLRAEVEAMAQQADDIENHVGQQAASVGATTADPGKTAEVHRLRQRLAYMQKSIRRMLRSIQARFCNSKSSRVKTQC